MNDEAQALLVESVVQREPATFKLYTRCAYNFVLSFKIQEAIGLRQYNMCLDYLRCNQYILDISKVIFVI